MKNIKQVIGIVMILNIVPFFSLLIGGSYWIGLALEAIGISFLAFLFVSVSLITGDNKTSNDNNWAD